MKSRSTFSLATIATIGLFTVASASCADDPIDSSPIVTTTPSSNTTSTVTPAEPTTTTAPLAPVPTASESVRLISATKEPVTIDYPQGAEAYLVAPVYLVSEDANLEFVVRRERYGDPLVVSAELVTQDGRRRTLKTPADVRVEWSGLQDFLDVTVLRPNGTPVFNRTVDFCPNGATNSFFESPSVTFPDAQRVSDSGPDLEEFTFGCTAQTLSLASRWGVSQGWARLVAGTAIPTGDLGAGRYTVRVGLAEPYHSWLGAPAAAEYTTVLNPVEGLEIVDSDNDGIPDFLDDSFDDTGEIVDQDADEDGIADIEDPLIDWDGDGVADIGDADGDGIADHVDVLTDVDGDGSPDEIIDADNDGIIDIEDPLIDADGDGIAEPIEPETEGIGDPAAPAKEPPAHAGRPAGQNLTPDPASLPDLRTLPAFGISTYNEGSKDYLFFHAVTWNAGPAPMLIDGYRNADNPELMTAFQTFYLDGKKVGSGQIGSLEFHAGGEHNHWHFLDFARYELISDTTDEVFRDTKQSWCLVNNYAVDLSLPGSNGYGASSLTTSCGDQSAMWIRETLSAGWGDLYGPGVGGQGFDITTLPNGWYTIRMIANPEGNMYEADTTNNVTDRRVLVGGVAGNRTVTVPPYEGLDTESEFVVVG